MSKEQIPRHFKFSNTAAIDLTQTQLLARDSISEKIKNHEYKFELTNCPVCAETHHIVLAERDCYGFPVTNVVCMQCGHVYSNPRIDDASLRKLYQNEYRALDRPGLESSDYFELEREKGNIIYDLIERCTDISKIKNKTVIDIGCGAGGVLEFFRNKGFNVYGCDLSPENISHALERNIPVCYGSITELLNVIKEKQLIIGLVLYEQVFEHLSDPNKELKLLRMLLPSDVLIYIGVPGFKNIRNHYNSDLIRYLQLPHLSHYEARTIKYLADNNGYKLLYADEISRCILVKDDIPHSADTNPSNYIDVIKYTNKLELIRKINYPASVIRKYAYLTGKIITNFIRCMPISLDFKNYIIGVFRKIGIKLLG
jgi:SAM-dependent methyltransferase